MSVLKQFFLETGASTAETLGFKMVKQTNFARVTLAPKQAQIAENSTALTRMNIPFENSCKTPAGVKYRRGGVICKLEVGSAM